MFIYIHKYYKYNIHIQYITIIVPGTYIIYIYSSNFVVKKFYNDENCNNTVERFRIRFRWKLDNMKGSTRNMAVA